MYWDISRAASQNALFNFIVGARGAGKTYGTKKRGIDDFLETGEQWIYVRRYARELKTAAPRYFDDIAGAYPDHSFEIKNGCGRIDGKPAVWFLALTTAKINKSVSYPAVKTIIFDEFILDRGVYHYLPDEVVQFLELYETVARMRDVRVWFLANALSIINPYFAYFRVRPPERGRIGRSGEILIEITQDLEYEEAKMATRFGRLIAGTHYGEYAINNDFLRDDMTNVEDLPGGCTYLFTLLHPAGDVGVWGASGGRLWCTRTIDKNCRGRYNCGREDVQGVMDARGRIRLPALDHLRRCWQRGLVRFDRLDTKRRMEQIIRYMGAS